MQYMLLIYTAPDSNPKPGSKEFGPMMEGYFALSAAMRDAGVYVSGDGLQGPETATSVRVRGGKRETMDGPFAETKEVFGGYYLIEVENLDAALGWAARIPSAAWGTIEVRPIMVY